MTKQEQLKKNREQNQKKLSTVVLADFKNFIWAKSGGLCQCGCGKHGVEYHHSLRGAYKDDKSIILICRSCHNLIHNCEYNNMDKTSELMILAKVQGVKNWKDFKHE